MKVNYSIAAKLGGGGIGTTAYYAVSGIFRHGDLNRVYCSSFNPQKIAELPDLPLSTTHSALVERLPFISQTHQWAMKDRLHDYLVSFSLPKVDIFHGWNGHCLRSLNVSKKSGAVTIVERASSHPNTYEKLLQSEYGHWGIKIPPIAPAVKKRLLKELELADYITTPSDFAYQSMVENGIPENKLIRLSFGADVEKLKVTQQRHPDPPAGGEGSIKTKNKFTVLFVGQVGIRKGVPYLLEAWKKLDLKEADLYLLGEVEPVAESLLAPYRGLSSVHFEGYTDPGPYYQKADVFVFPSLEEGSALVTYEALSYGVPLITTFNSGSVVTDGQEGYVVPIRNSDQIAQRLQMLCNNETLRGQMRAAAGGTGRCYSWQGYGDNLAAAYEKLV